MFNLCGVHPMILCYPVILSLACVLSFVLSLKQPRPGMGPAAAGCRHRRRRQTSLRRCVFFAPREIHAMYCLWHDLWGYIMSWWYNVYITYNFVAPPAEIETQQYRCWEYDMICGLSGVIPISQTCSYHLRWVGATLVIQQEMGDLQPTNFI